MIRTEIGQLLSRSNYMMRIVNSEVRLSTKNSGQKIEDRKVLRLVNRSNIGAEGKKNKKKNKYKINF